MNRGKFITPYLALRAVTTHIGKSPVCLGSLAAGLCMKEAELEIRLTDAMVGGTGAAGQRRICDTNRPVDACFVKKR